MQRKTSTLSLAATVLAVTSVNVFASSAALAKTKKKTPPKTPAKTAPATPKTPPAPPEEKGSKYDRVEPLVFQPDGTLIYRGLMDVNDFRDDSGARSEYKPFKFLIKRTAKGEVTSREVAGDNTGRTAVVDAWNATKTLQMPADLPAPPTGRKIGTESTVINGPEGITIEIPPPASEGTDPREKAKANLVIGGQTVTTSTAMFPKLPPGNDAEATALVLWSADGLRAAVAINRILSDGAGGGGADSVLMVMSLPDLVKVDVTDAGGTKKVKAMSDKLKKAGFQVAHNGKVTAQDDTEVRVASGYEALGKALAKAAGLQDSAVKPAQGQGEYPVIILMGSK
jgi:hypothetical protein